MPWLCKKNLPLGPETACDCQWHHYLKTALSFTITADFSSLTDEYKRFALNFIGNIFLTHWSSSTAAMVLDSAILSLEETGYIIRTT